MRKSALILGGALLIALGAEVWAQSVTRPVSQLQVSNAKLSDSTVAMKVWIAAADGTQITSFGGGQQYDHGEAITLASANGSLIGGRVSAAAPSTAGVADDDYAAFWVKNTGLQVVGSSKVEDSASADGDDGVVLLARRTLSPTNTSGTDGDYEAVQVNAGRLWVDASGVTLTVDGELPTAAALADNTANPTAPAVGSFNMCWDGSTWDRCAASLVVEAEEDAAETAGGRGYYAMSVRRDTAAASAGTSGDNATINTDSLGRMWTRPGGPCSDHARISSVAIDTATSGNVQLVALNGSDIFYVCGFNFIADAAVDVQFITGTGSACATGETDKTGPYGAGANGGISVPNAGYPQFASAAGDALCIELSGAVQVSGMATYVRTATP